MESLLSIDEVARRTGLTAHTLRYYERIGLIAPVARAATTGTPDARAAAARIARPWAGEEPVSTTRQPTSPATRPTVTAAGSASARHTRSPTGANAVAEPAR